VEVDSGAVAPAAGLAAADLGAVGDLAEDVRAVAVGVRVAAVEGGPGAVVVRAEASRVVGAQAVEAVATIMMDMPGNPGNRAGETFAAAQVRFTWVQSAEVLLNIRIGGVEWLVEVAQVSTNG
jgi:hypothetical protein